jgi:hypothetical protein
MERTIVNHESGLARLIAELVVTGLNRHPDRGAAAAGQAATASTVAGT